jgi:hypothetical protein
VQQTASGKGDPAPQIAAIRLGVSRACRRTPLQRCAASLEKKGYLEREPGRASNSYRLDGLFDKLRGVAIAKLQARPDAVDDAADDDAEPPLPRAA